MATATYGRQISTLVQHRSERPHATSERTMRAIGRVGQAVNLAVERFVTVGETIADDNPEIKADMYEACKEARAAGSSIERLCEITATDPLGYPPPDGPLADRSAMVRSARSLLSSVTRVLLLADIVVVKQLLLAKDKVAKSLGRLESVANFTEFVKAFSVFGAEMVELAHVTGDRQNDLKNERRRAQMSAARQVLERSTMMLLTSSKTCLRHPECSSSRENRDTVFCQMRRAMDLIHFVVKDGVLESSSISASLDERLSPRSQIINDWDAERATVYTALRNFTRLVELYRPRYNNYPLPQQQQQQQHQQQQSSTLLSQSLHQQSSIQNSLPPQSSSLQLANNANISASPKALTIANPKDISNGNDRILSSNCRDDRRSGCKPDSRGIIVSNSVCSSSNIVGNSGGGGGSGVGGTIDSPPSQSTQEFIRRDVMRSNSVRDRHIVNDTSHKGRSYMSLDRDIIPCRMEIINQEMSVLNAESREQLMVALDKVVEKTQDFTDSAYTSHENRENILLLCDRCRLELNQCLRIAVSMEPYSNSSYDLDGQIDNVITAAHDLSTQLAISVADQTPELNHVIKLGIDLVNNFRIIAINQELDRLQEKADRFHDYIDHIVDVLKLLRHIALTETLQIQAKFTEINLRIYGPQVITAARVLATYPSSKISKENLEVFVDMWQWLASDVSSVSKEVIEMAQSQAKPDRLEYLSLPRPGKHGTTSKPLKPARLDQEEQEKIAKSGLEMKMLTNEMDAETDKWNGESEENNDIVKRAKNMSAMAFSMYQFTKGEGTLRTTQDLFTQAEYFAEEANRLYKVVRQFSYQVPAGDNKKELLDQLDKVPTYVQTLQFTVKDPTVGKAATFVKVDHVIRETKNLMNNINKVVTTCFECANKYKLDFSGLAGRAAAGARDDDSGPGGMGDSKGSTASTEGSM